MAAIVTAASVAVLVLRARRGVVDPRSLAVVATLAIAGALGAAGWRLGTSSYGGADIGGPFVLLLVPLLIAELLVGAVWLAGAGRWGLRRIWLLSVAAVLVAPALSAMMHVLRAYDASAGLITARQYAEVRVGQTRSAVHERLGREGSDEFAMFHFAPVPLGLLCDYYDEVDAGGQPLPHAYQFCFRAGVLVSKDLSVGEPFLK